MAKKPNAEEVPAEDAPGEETEETPPLEIVVGEEKDEAEEKPEVVTMTPEEFAALKAQGESAKAIKEGIEGLSTRLGQPQPHVQPVNVPTQTPEEFFAEHSDEIFDKEKGAALLAKHSKMVAEREYGTLLRGLSTSLVATRKELLEAKDPYFKKYAGEIDALVASQPPEVRMQPDIYERAWREVRQKHSAEIEEETVNAKVDAAVEAKLKALGIDPTKSAGRPAVHVNSEGRSTPTVSERAAPRVRLPDEATKAKFEREARRKGMDLADYLRTKGYTI